MSRVLATDEAKAAIAQMQNIISGGLDEQIRNLNTQGGILSDANVWDGPLAQQFRGSVWPDTHTALNKVQTELTDLREQLDQIALNIMTAGGGA